MLEGRLTLTPIDALTELTWKAQDLAEKAGGRRVAIGIAGGPGTGKSTLAAQLVAALNVANPGSAALVPMDGFHMKHAKLEGLGQTDFKGAPHTFEAGAFVAFLQGLKAATGPVSGPGYSRKIEDTVEDAFTVPAETQVLVVEGNYLLLDTGDWAQVRPLLDFSAFIVVPREMVRERLMKRHGEEGLFSEERNRAHIERNDLPNYDLIMTTLGRADLVIDLEVAQ
jgi:pantothenate kinase